MIISKLFGFDSQKHSIKAEILAGITTFLTMAYILAVNPAVFSALPGMPSGSVFTATALASIIGTQVMAKLEAARKAGKPIDGHAPGLMGEERKQYAQAGITSDHECSSLEEGRLCIEAAMKPMASLHH
jgi:AGZA family xanthine/uracil permease-like MFS transporter